MNKIFLAGACLLFSFTAAAGELPAYPFIHVNGTGMATVMPDIGAIDFEIIARDADPALAMQVVATRAAEIRALLQGAGLADDSADIRDMRKDLSKADPAVVAYEIRCSVKLRITDLSKWKSIVAPLLDMPNLDGFMTVFDTSDRLKVEMELMADAIKMARRKGEGIAAGFGRKLGAVGGVSSGELKNLTRAMNLTPADFNYRDGDRREQADRGELLAVTALKLAQPVDVIFKLK
ncbi:MAG: SIMPL domain-containing protein [Pseudomonadota bacterium]